MLNKLFIIAFLCLLNFNIFGANNRIIIASTTSTHDSGLINYINNAFEKKFNIEAHVLALGTGQAIIVAKNGDADILLSHDPSAEIEFVKSGYGIKRHKLMYNDYILVGPKNDKDNCESIEEKLLKIKNNKLPFISRADNSGTNIKEIALWKNIQFDTEIFTDWYRKIGQGMGATLLMANELEAYTLSDRGTWINFNKKEKIKIICENYPLLLNQYSIIAVNSNANSKVNTLGAKKYINWIISDDGKKLINSFKKNNKQLFYFNHH